MTDLARESAIVLDSWHLRDGAGIAVERHRTRFTASVAEIFGVPVDESAAAYDQAGSDLPRTGSFFPAFVWTSTGLRCVVRTFPVEQLRRGTTLLETPLLDIRNRPDVKGIDYLWQLEQRATAVAAGYDDRLLVTPDGSVSETIFATLVLIRGSQLVVPDAPRLASVTLSVIADRAADHGLTVRERAVTPEAVAGSDSAFTLSALHGVRLVQRWGEHSLPGDSRLRDALQDALESARRPVTSHFGYDGDRS